MKLIHIGVPNLWNIFLQHWSCFSSFKLYSTRITDFFFFFRSPLGLQQAEERAAAAWEKEASGGAASTEVPPE